jgi:CBS domain-containing protein
MPTVRQVLAEKGREVHHIHPDASVLAALEIMAEHQIGALVVLEGGNLAGIITERDYARKIVLKGRTSPGTKVREIMSTRVICARLDQTVEQCMAVMTAKAVRHLPVLEHKQVAGIVSIGDMVKSIIADQKFVIEQLEHYISGGR